MPRLFQRLHLPTDALPGDALIVVALACWVLLLCVAGYAGTRSATLPLEPPALTFPFSGLHARETLPDDGNDRNDRNDENDENDGTAFRWTNGHATLTLPNPGGSTLLRLRLSSGAARVVPVRLAAAGQHSQFLVGPGVRSYSVLLPPTPAARLVLHIQSPTMQVEARALGVMLSRVQVWGGGWPPVQVVLLLLLAALCLLVLLRQRGWSPRLSGGVLAGAMLAAMLWHRLAGWQSGLFVPLLLLLAGGSLTAAALLRWYRTRPQAAPLDAAALSRAASPLALWAVLIFIIVVVNIIRITKDFDDLSVLRASSYLVRSGDDPLLARLHSHLDRHEAALGGWVHQRYLNRFEQANSYPLQNALIALAEELPLYSPFQSVFLSTLLLHLAAAGCLFWLCTWLFGREGRVLQLGLLLSSAHIAMLMGIFPTPPLLFAPFLGAHHATMWLTPYPTWDQTWLVPASRAAALLFFLGALLLWLAARQRPGKQRHLRLLALLVLAAAFLAHISMALLFLLPALLIGAGYRLLRCDPASFGERFGWRATLLLYNLAIAAASALLLLVLVFFFTDRYHLLPPASQMIPRALLLSNALLLAWLTLRGTPALAASPLRGVGDGLLALALPLTAGLTSAYLFDPLGAAQVDDLYLVLQARHRLAGLVHVLWWLLLALCLFAAALRWRLQVPRLAVTGVLVLLCALMTAKYEGALARDFAWFDQELLQIRASTLLQREGITVYQDETRYYQSIANELHARRE